MGLEKDDSMTEEAVAVADESSGFSGLTRWVTGVVLTGLVSGTALLIAAGYGKVQEHDMRLRAVELQLAQSQEDRRALHETLLRMEATDSRLEQKLDKLLDRRGGQ